MKRLYFFPLLVLSLFLMSGCFDMEADITIKEDNSGDMEYVIAADAGMYEAFKEEEGVDLFKYIMQDYELKEDIEVTDISSDDREGFKLAMSFNRLEDIVGDRGGIRIELKEGSLEDYQKVVISFDAEEIDMYDVDEIDEEWVEMMVDFELTLDLPTEPLLHNAESVEGTVLTWDICPVGETVAEVEYEAEEVIVKETESSILDQPVYEKEISTEEEYQMKKEKKAENTSGVKKFARDRLDKFLEGEKYKNVCIKENFVPLTSVGGEIYAYMVPLEKNEQINGFMIVGVWEDNFRLFQIYLDKQKKDLVSFLLEESETSPVVYKYPSMFAVKDGEDYYLVDNIDQEKSNLGDNKEIFATNPRKVLKDESISQEEDESYHYTSVSDNASKEVALTDYENFAPAGDNYGCDQMWLSELGYVEPEISSISCSVAATSNTAYHMSEYKSFEKMGDLYSPEEIDKEKFTLHMNEVHQYVQPILIEFSEIIGPGFDFNLEIGLPPLSLIKSYFEEFAASRGVELTGKIKTFDQVNTETGISNNKEEVIDHIKAGLKKDSPVILRTLWSNESALSDLERHWVTITHYKKDSSEGNLTDRYIGTSNWANLRYYNLDLWFEDYCKFRPHMLRGAVYFEQELDPVEFTLEPREVDMQVEDKEQIEIDIERPQKDYSLNKSSSNENVATVSEEVYGEKYEVEALEAGNAEIEFAVDAPDHELLEKTIEVKVQDTGEKNELTVDADGEGKVEVDGKVVDLVYKKEYEEGREVKLEAKPGENRAFLEWEGEVEEPGDPVTNVIMEEDKEIRAVFGKINLPENALIFLEVQDGEVKDAAGFTMDYLFDYEDAREVMNEYIIDSDMDRLFYQMPGIAGGKWQGVFEGEVSHEKIVKLISQKEKIDYYDYEDGTKVVGRWKIIN